MKGLVQFVALVSITVCSLLIGAWGDWTNALAFLVVIGLCLFVFYAVYDALRALVRHFRRETRVEAEPLMYAGYEPPTGFEISEGAIWYDSSRMRHLIFQDGVWVPMTYEHEARRKWWQV